MSAIVQSFRVEDPTDFRVTMMCLAGWVLVDVTYDPHQRNWVMTVQLEI